MLSEILTTISAGISIVNGITNLLRNTSNPNTNEPLCNSINSVQDKVLHLKSEVNSPDCNNDSLLRAYSELIKFLQKDKFYSSRVEIFPTEYGTWRIKRKPMRKKTILRDPEGEF